MALNVVEIPGSRQISKGERYSQEWSYRVFTTLDAREAEYALLSGIPAMREGLLFQGITQTETDTSGIWTFRVTYGDTETRATRDLKPEATQGGANGSDGGGGASDDNTPIAAGVHIDLSGEQTHIVRSLKTVARYPKGAVDYKQAIGVTDESVEGVDVETGLLTWTEPVEIPAAKVTRKWKRELGRLYYGINDKPFKGYEKGEVQFRGGTGERVGDKWKFNFRFAVRFNENKTPMQVWFGNIANPEADVAEVEVSKAGWDYIWFQFDPILQKERMVLVPTAIYVEQIFHYRNFDLLMMGR